MLSSQGKIVTHRGRAHVDDFLASCVCLHKTGLPLYRDDVTAEMLDDPSCWVLDQGLRLEPDLLNFDHHHVAERVCSLTLLLDHFYGPSYREHIPQLSYIEIHDSVGASKAGKFAGLSYEGLEIASSLVQNLLLSSFSRIEGLVDGPMRVIMVLMGMELCERIEGISSDMDDLERNARIIEFSGIKVLDVAGCETKSPDRLPTKTWCKSKGLNPDAILNRDARVGAYRLISTSASVSFPQNEICEYTHPSGFLTVFRDIGDWGPILAAAIKCNR